MTVESARRLSNTGHGHVFARPDGVKARCGGPGLCTECSKDQARLKELGLAPPKTAREGQLENLIRRLIDALDVQTFAGHRPGAYSYSMNVSGAIEDARRAIAVVEPESDPDPADVAHEVKSKSVVQREEP